jgi:hypothetical protein
MCKEHSPNMWPTMFQSVNLSILSILRPDNPPPLSLHIPDFILKLYILIPFLYELFPLQLAK